MKTIVAFSILCCILVACGRKHAEGTEVKLENGSAGLMAHCNGNDDQTCVADLCKKGGQILHRNVGNDRSVVINACQ